MLHQSKTTECLVQYLLFLNLIYLPPNNMLLCHLMDFCHLYVLHKLYKECLDEKNPTARSEKHMVYKIKRNCVTSSQRKSKKYQLNAFFEENQSNIKETWQGIRKLINVSKKSTTNISKLNKNGKEITSPKEMADTINDFYVNIDQDCGTKNSNG